MKNKNGTEIKLRCFAYPGIVNGQDGYYAICLDISVSTWRPSLAAAKNSLNDAICGYIEEKVKLEKISSNEEFWRTIRRPAPFFPYWSKYLLCKISRPHRKTGARKTIYEKPINQLSFCGA